MVSCLGRTDEWARPLRCQIGTEVPARPPLAVRLFLGMLDKLRERSDGLMLGTDGLEDGRGEWIVTGAKRCWSEGVGDIFK